jgi:hypothetical protein
MAKKKKESAEELPARSPADRGAEPPAPVVPPAPQAAAPAPPPAAAPEAAAAPPDAPMPCQPFYFDTPADGTNPLDFSGNPLVTLLKGRINRNCPPSSMGYTVDHSSDPPIAIMIPPDPGAPQDWQWNVTLLGTACAPAGYWHCISVMGWTANGVLVLSNSFYRRT